MLAFEEPLIATDKFEILRLPLDGEYFGFPCARVSLTGPISDTDLHVILDAVAGYKFTTVVNNGNGIGNNQLIQKHGGFIQTDINIQMKKRVIPASPVHREGLSIRSNWAADEDLLRIADRAFIHSRFFNDPMMDRAKSAGFYRRWLSLSFGREDKYVISAGEPQPEGFLLFRCAGDALVIELIGVLPGAGGKGTGSAMIALLNEFAAEKGYAFLQTGTQLENVDALRFYQKNGFYVVRSSSIYHYWR